MIGIDNLLLVALIVFLAIPAPLLIVMYFVTRWKQSREISGGDEAMLEELWRLAGRLEDRLASIETILDSELHEWRKRI